MSEESIWECIRELQQAFDDLDKRIFELENKQKG
jgi:hypothetical protein